MTASPSAGAPPSPAELRARIEDVQRSLDEQFTNGAEVEALIRSRAHFLDSLLSELFHAMPWPESDGRDLPVAVLAVGGYGRGELHPHSDIDLLVLHEADLDPAWEAVIERFLTMLWDLSLQVGHSVRTVAECREQAAADLTIMTNLLESRTIAGPERLRLEMNEVIAEGIWPSKAFFEAKLQEQERRHERFEDTEYNLEPNVKSSPGGLRDIQMIGWIARRHFGTSDLESLIGLRFLTASELLTLVEGRQFLWRVRWGLHMLSGRGDDRLLLDHQRELAGMFGYEDSPGLLAVEQFMHDYYRHVLALRELNDLILQHFDEVIVRANEPETIRPINERFQVRNDYIEVTAPDVFTQSPSALMELFYLMANHAEVQGVRASTIRLVRDSLDLIDDAFRAAPRNAELFMALLRSPNRLVSQLTRMRRYGVLGRYLPEFGRVIGQMQHDLFHLYTVDAHTMLVIRNMRQFQFDAAREQFPVAHHCMKSIPKVELLYVAGIYHDIAKGRGGDHSELGALDVERFAARHGLDAEDTELVRWLVEVHLLMSATAQRKDISDPEVIATFAREVRTEERLDYLYALTVADINATNPTLWNSWRAQLLRQLYTETRRFLRRGLDQEVDRSEWIGETREAALVKLSDKGLSRESVLAVWEATDDEYFLKHDHNEIAWQTEAVSRHDLEQDGPLVLLRDQSGQVIGEGATQVFIFTRDHPNLFAATVAALDQLNLSVQDARIHTSDNDLCFNTYMVLEDGGGPVGDRPQRIEEIRRTLQQVLASPDRFPSIVSRRVPRQLRHFSIPTQVDFGSAGGNGCTEMRIVAADRPGLLARLGLIFMEQGISVLNAKIATLGERIDDVFQITDTEGRPITDEQRLEHIRDSICSGLAEALD